MNNTTISSFFTRNGVGADDIQTLTPGYPTIRVWKVTPSTNELIIGPGGSGLNSDGVLTPVSDGFYTFNFNTAAGFEPAAEYLVKVDGGESIPNDNRIQTNSISPNNFDLPATNLNVPGSIGNIINQTILNTNQLMLDIQSVFDLVDIVSKYSTNRTMIDTTNAQLIVYDDDCTTILRVFQLLDSSGNPSTSEVCERVPVAATDGKPTC